jgi:hypothetical protein
MPGSGRWGGGEILFHAFNVTGIQPSSQADLFAVDVAGGAVRRLTEEPLAGGIVDDRDPAWSPQRTRLVSYREDSKGVSLVLRQSDGNPIAELPVAGREPVWMTNHRLLCGVIGRDAAGKWNRTDLVTVATHDAATTPLTAAAPCEFFASPAWHPTSGLVATLTRTDPAVHLELSSHLVWVAAARVKSAITGGPPVTSAEVVPLATGEDRCTDPAWSPDGTTVAFATGRPCVSPGLLQQCEIALVRPARPHHIRLVTDDSAARYADGIDDLSPVFSPDGLWLAWARGYEHQWAHLIVQRIGAPKTRHVLLGDKQWCRGGLSW